MTFDECFISCLKLKLDLDEADIEIAFEEYKHVIESNSDRFLIVIHLVMLQNGFKREDSCGGCITKQKHFSQLSYNSFNEFKFETNVKIIVNSILNRLTIQAFYKNYKTESIFSVDKKRLDVCFSLSSEVDCRNRNKKELVIEFKNSILNQLKLFIYETFNRSLLTGKALLYLPNELMLKITKSLDIKTVIELSMSCKAFRQLIIDQNLLKECNRRLVHTTSCNLLWKYFLKRDFLNEYVKYEEDTHNFYLIYRDAYRRKRGVHKRTFAQASSAASYYHSSSYDDDDFLT